MELIRGAVKPVKSTVASARRWSVSRLAFFRSEEVAVGRL